MTKDTRENENLVSSLIQDLDELADNYRKRLAPQGTRVGDDGDTGKSVDPSDGDTGKSVDPSDGDTGKSIDPSDGDTGKA